MLLWFLLLSLLLSPRANNTHKAQELWSCNFYWLNIYFTLLHDVIHRPIPFANLWFNLLSWLIFPIFLLFERRATERGSRAWGRGVKELVKSNEDSKLLIVMRIACTYETRVGLIRWRNVNGIYWYLLNFSNKCCCWLSLMMTHSGLKFIIVRASWSGDFINKDGTRQHKMNLKVIGIMFSVLRPSDGRFYS